MKDGRLDTPLEQACLIASGADTPKKMQPYLTKISDTISHIEHDTNINKANDPAERATIIFDWLQKNENEGTYNDCYDIKDTLKLKVGNCLSYAIRFTIICRHFGIDIKNIFIPGHIYNTIATHGSERCFEHTHSDGIVKKADKYHPQKKIMKDEELIAEIFLYKARNANNELHHEDSINYCRQALMLNPDDNRPVILFVDNHIAKKRYAEAFRYLDGYLSRHPNDKISFEKTYTLLKKLCEKEDNRF